MSLINVFLSPDKAIIGVDTEGLDCRTNAALSMSKMVYLPHMNVVIAGRGTAGCLAFISCHLHSMQFFVSHGTGLDDVAAVMPEVFRNAYATAYTLQKAAPTITPVPDKQELVLVGWSNQAGAMRAMVYKLSGPDDEIEITEITEQQNYSVPWDAKWGDWPTAAAGNSIEEMAELAQLQTWKHKQDFPSPGIGGRLMIAELTRDRVSMFTHCELTASEAKVVMSLQDLQRMVAAG